MQNFGVWNKGINIIIVEYGTLFHCDASFSCGGKKLMSSHNEGFSVGPIEIVMWHIWKKNHQLWNRYHHNQPS